MCSDAQIIAFALGQFTKVIDDVIIRRRITRILRSAKTNRKRKYFFTSLVETLKPQISMDFEFEDGHTSVSMRDLPVPELWTTVTALA